MIYQAIFPKISQRSSLSLVVAHLILLSEYLRNLREISYFPQITLIFAD